MSSPRITQDQDDVNVFQTIDNINTFAIVEDNDDENDDNAVPFETMVCTDDLPVYAQTIEYVDPNIPILFTREQLLFHVLNTITHKARVDDQSRWIRKATGFVDLFLDHNDPTENTLIRPIILGHRYMILNEEEIGDANLVENLLQEDNYVATTQSRLLNRRQVNKNTASYTDYIEHMYKVEQTFKQSSDDDTISIHYTVPRTSNAYVFQTEPSDVDGATNGNHVVFGKSNIYAGDVVQVFGFLYKGLDSNSDKAIYEWIDAESYRTSLKNLQVGDKVYVYPHASQSKLSGRVQQQADTYCLVELRNGSTVKIYTNHIWNNNEFVYAASNKRRFVMNGIVSAGIAFSLLQGDTDGKLTLKAFVPSPAIVALHNKDVIHDLTSLKHVLQDHGYQPWQSNYIPQDVLADVLALSPSLMNGPSPPDAVTSEPAARADLGKMPLNLEKYNYNPYSLEGTYSDTEYHRLKHLFSQGDAGLAFVLEALAANIRSTRTRIGRQLDQINAWIQSFQTRDDRGEYGEDVDEDEDACAARTRNYAKIYESTEALEADNHKVLDGVKKGDFAKLVLGDKVEDYRRFEGNDRDEMWVKDLSLASIAKFKCTNADHLPLKAEEFIKLDCLYDDLKRICVSMELMKRTAVKTNEQNKFVTMLGTKDFVDGVDYYLAEIEVWKKKIGSFISLVNVLRDREKLHDLSAQPAFVTETHDYSQHIGDPNAFDFEETYGNVDFGDKEAYTALRTDGAKENDEDNVRSLLATKLDNEEDNLSRLMVDAISTATGISFSDGIMKRLALRAATSDVPLTAEDIEKSVFTRRMKEVAAFERNIRQQLAKRLKRPITEADVTKQRRIFNDQLAKNLADLRKSLGSEMKNGQRIVLFNLCAMFVILMQINVGYISNVNPSCRESFSTGMASYVACVIHKMASFGNGGGGVFTLASDMTLDKVEALLAESIARILDEKASLKTAYEQATASPAAKDIATRLLARKPVDVEWPSFRPFIKEIHGTALPKSLGQQMDNLGAKRRRLGCKTTPIVLMKSAADSVGNNGDTVPKNIEMPKRVEIISPALTAEGKASAVPWVKSDLPADLVRSLSNNWDGWDDNIIDASLASLNNLPVAIGVMKPIQDLYRTKSADFVLTANNLKMFVCGELRCIVGRLKSKWKLGSEEKPSEFDKALAQIVEKLDGSPEAVSKVLMPKFEQLTKTLTNAGMLNNIPNPENKMYAFLYMLVHVTSEIANVVQQKNQPPVVKQRVSEIIEFILKACITNMQLNTFYADRIKHSQEALREKSKEDIIARFEAMDEESRRAVLEMKKAGHKTFADLLFEIDAADTAPTNDMAEDNNRGETYPEYDQFRGDNDERDVDTYDVEDGANDAWEDPDD